MELTNSNNKIESQDCQLKISDTKIQNNNSFKRMHISNIPFRYRESDLRNLLKPYGQITDVEIIFNERGSKGFCFVTFANGEDADRAKVHLNGVEVEGRRLEVNVATTRIVAKKKVENGVSAVRYPTVSLINQPLVGIKPNYQTSNSLWSLHNSTTAIGQSSPICQTNTSSICLGNTLQNSLLLNANLYSSPNYLVPFTGLSTANILNNLSLNNRLLMSPTISLGAPQTPQHPTLSASISPSQLAAIHPHLIGSPSLISPFHNQSYSIPKLTAGPVLNHHLFNAQRFAPY